MRCHFLRVLERAAVREVSRNPSGAERVAANFCRDAAAAARRRIIRQASGWLIGLPESLMEADGEELIGASRHERLNYRTAIATAASKFSSRVSLGEEFGRAHCRQLLRVGGRDELVDADGLLFASCGGMHAGTPADCARHRFRPLQILIVQP
jgi:hypothetical protein